MRQEWFASRREIKPFLDCVDSAGGACRLAGLDKARFRPVNCALLRMDNPANPRWLTVLPLQYADKGGPKLFNRDAGALCLGFRALGVGCRYVALGPAGETQEPPLILDEITRMQDPAWWRDRQADWVVFFSWGAPALEPVARAIKAAGLGLIVRMDCDGIKSPHVHFWRYFAATRSAAVDARRWFPAAYALAKSAVLRWVNPVVERGMLRHLAHADFVLVESHLARQYLAAFCQKFGQDEVARKLRVAPHPGMVVKPYPPGVPKQKRVLAVGRWESHQKDAPTVVRALGLALGRYPDHEADLFGSGEDRLRELVAPLPEAVRRRLHIHGQMDHARVQEFYQRSRIILFGSRHEGFPLSASEALCSGCTVVGPALLPSMNHIGACGGGTLAVSRHPDDLANALGGEIELWEAGERDPAGISAYWMKRVSVEASARFLLGLAQGGVVGR